MVRKITALSLGAISFFIMFALGEEFGVSIAFSVIGDCKLFCVTASLNIIL